MISDLEKRYQEYRVLLKQQSGIDIGDNKHTLLESRISRRFAAVNARDFSEYLGFIKSNSDELKIFVESMTTNKTDWFREPNHFQFLEQQFGRIKNRSTSSPIMIWSAASSSGEEAYSIAITCEEVLGPQRNYRILGTDINTQVLQKAQNGIYSASYLKSQVSDSRIRSWFRPSTPKENLQISEEIRSQVKFRPFNLLESELPPDLEFDFIFLRNVLIYFDQPTIENVISRLTKRLKRGGYLVVGNSETLNGIHHSLKHLGQSIYIYE